MDSSTRQDDRTTRVTLENPTYPALRGGSLCFRCSTAPGIPVIFIHGAGGDHSNFDAQLDGLDGVPCLALDLPWHGESRFPGSPDFGLYAEAVLEAAGIAGYDRFVAAGHSMGGGVLFELWRLVPERIAGTIFMSTGATLPVNPAIPDLIRKDFGAFCAMAAQMCFNPGGDAARAASFRGVVEGNGPDVSYYDFTFCSRFDYRDTAATIDVPTLIITSERDGMVSRKVIAALHDAIRGSRVAVIPTRGHMPHIDEPGAVNREIAAFMRGLS
ncbi:MAG: alpha/beta hydrolase [Spirochaetes bacterium]|nr:alpha/beta hydrolase [Spirochaetota bacterium]